MARNFDNFRPAGNSYQANGGRNYNTGGQRAFGNQNFNNNGQGQRFKKSAFTVGKKDGRPFGYGWLKNRNGLTKFFIRPKYVGGKVQEYANKDGLARTKCIVEITVGFQTNNFPGVYYPEKNRFTCEKLNLLFTPNGGGVTRKGIRVRGAIVSLR